MSGWAQTALASPGRQAHNFIVFPPGIGSGVLIESEQYEEKLVAIVYADVAGYSRLTGEDEIGTHPTLSTYLDLFTEAIEQHTGQVVHYAGDAILAEFTTVSNTPACALSVQQT